MGTLTFKSNDVHQDLITVFNFYVNQHIGKYKVPLKQTAFISK